MQPDPCKYITGLKSYLDLGLRNSQISIRLRTI